MSRRASISFFSLRRILIVAQSTVTQLVRMKVFYFLAPIAPGFSTLSLIPFGANSSTDKNFWGVHGILFDESDL